LRSRGRAAAIASDRRLQSWYVVVEFFLSVFLHVLFSPFFCGFSCLV
jgi:hypothetical protein